MSGDDALTLAMMVLGGSGIISVCSNLLPKEISTLCHLALEGRWSEARVLHYKLYEIVENLFIETNPIPVKAAMAMAGMINEEYRLPMSPMAPKNREILRQSLIKFGLDV